MRKHSPLAAIYRQWGAHCTEVQGWWIAEHFGDLEAERESLSNGALIVDWSHLGKLALRGDPGEAQKWDPAASTLKPLKASISGSQALLRLTEDEFLMLCPAGSAEEAAGRIDSATSTVTNQSGALGCFVLAGINRDAVLERSSAMNLRRDLIGAGSAIQTSFHLVNTTLLRTSHLEILIHPREFSHSLFEALMDVGKGVGLRPSGLSALPVTFEEQA